MKRTLKILGIVIGSISALVIVGLIAIFGSNYISAKNEVENPVYEPDKIWSFRADFYDKKGDLFRQDTIQLTTYNQRFLLFQNKVTWSLKKGNVATEQTTGIVEDENKIWLHPPRFDDYFKFTEYSAFPEIRQPAEVGKTWEMQLTLGTYATKETGSKMTVKYRIENIDTLSVEPLDREITILGQGISGLGTYKNRMIFTDSLGFIKMTFTKANEEKLIIDLIEKTDRI